MAEPLNATFFAFKKREQSGVVLRATIAFVIIAAAIVGAFLALNWASLAPAVSWYGEAIAAVANNNPDAVGAPPSTLLGLFGGAILLMFPFYILCAAYEAACLRWFIHGEVKGFMGLSIGAPTWRVWAVYWMWFLLNIAFTIAITLVSGLLIGVMAVSTGGDVGATASAQLVVQCIQYLLMIYFGVRLAPAAAATIARRKFAFFDAWAVTRGRFWSLLGAFALLYILYIVASFALVAVWFVVVLGPNAPNLAAAGSDPQALSAAFVAALQACLQSLADPKNWIIIGALQVVGTVIAVIFYVAMYGVNARAAQAALAEGKISESGA